MTSERDSASCRCPECHTRFLVLADEVGMHACPSCGYTGHEDEPSDPDGADDGPDGADERGED